MDPTVVRRVTDLLDTGSAIVVATVGPDQRVSVTRGWGATITDDGYVTAYVTAPPGSPTRLGLDTGGRIAMNVADPATYRSVQLKGLVDEVREPEADAYDRVESHVRKFTEICTTFGLHDVGRLMLGDLASVRFLATQAYDQTPGTDAGRAIG